MTPRELSLDEIRDIQSKPTRSSGGKHIQVPGTSRTVKIDPTVRTWEMWFKLPTSAQDCMIPEHDEEEHERKSMCFDLDGTWICRRCYLRGLP